MIFSDYFDLQTSVLQCWNGVFKPTKDSLGSTAFYELLRSRTPCSGKPWAQLSFEKIWRWLRVDKHSGPRHLKKQCRLSYSHRGACTSGCAGSEHPMAQIPFLTCNCSAAWPIFVIAPHSPDYCCPPVLGKALNPSELQPWPLQKKLLQSLTRGVLWKLGTSCFCSLMGAQRS